MTTSIARCRVTRAEFTPANPRLFRLRDGSGLVPVPGRNRTLFCRSTGETWYLLCEPRTLHRPHPDLHPVSEPRSVYGQEYLDTVISSRASPNSLSAFCRIKFSLGLDWPPTSVRSTLRISQWEEESIARVINEPALRAFNQTWFLIGCCANDSRLPRRRPASRFDSPDFGQTNSARPNTAISQYQFNSLDTETTRASPESETSLDGNDTRNPQLAGAVPGTSFRPSLIS